MTRNIQLCCLLLTIALCVGACTGCSGMGSSSTTYSTTTTASTTTAVTTTTAPPETTAVPEPIDEITGDVMGIVSAIEGSVLTIEVCETDADTDDLLTLDAASLTATGDTGSVVTAEGALIQFVYEDTMYTTAFEYIIEGDTIVVTYDGDGLQTITILESIEADDSGTAQ